MTEIKTVAIAGCGRAGRLHAEAAMELGLTVVAHSTTTELTASAKAFASLCPDSRWVTLDANVLCEAADLVILALPPEVCHRVVNDFVSQGRPMLVEKPLALDTNHILEIQQTLSSRGSRLAVGYNRRFYPLVQSVRQEFDQDPITWAEVNIVEDVDHLLRTKGETGAGSYLRVGAATHLLDLCRHMFGTGQPTAIQRHRSEENDWFVRYQITLLASNGAEVRVHIDDVGRENRGIRVGTRSGKVLQMRPLERLRVQAPTDSAITNVIEASEKERPDSYRVSFRRQLSAFLRADVTTLHSCYDSLYLSRVIDCLEEVVSRN